MHRHDQQHADWYRSLKTRQLRKAVVLGAAIQSRSRLLGAYHTWRLRALQEGYEESGRRAREQVAELTQRCEGLSREHAALTREVRDYSLVWTSVQRKYQVWI